jgi:hypothetical protein
MTPLSQHVLKRHLRSIGKTEKLANQVTALVRAALKAALLHLRDRPHPANLRDTLDGIQGVIERLRYTAALLVQDRLGELAAWGHAAMGKVLAMEVGRSEINAPKFHLAGESWKSEGIADYLKIIIRPPAKWFLRQLVGRAPELLTRLIDPQAASEIVLAGVAQGFDRTKIAKNLTVAFDGYGGAARRVVRTEGARIATESQLAVSEELPDIVIGYQINAVPKTEYSRPEHLKRSGTRYWREPKAGQLGFDQMPRPPIDPPGVVEYNCRCVTGNHRVFGSIKSISRAWYEGEGVELRTRFGARLTVTANHPVATDKGFVAAHALCEGNYVLSDGIRSCQFSDDVHDGVPTIEEVFEAALVSGGDLLIERPNSLEFHGDGKAMKGDVRVVFPDTVLMGGGYAEYGEGNDQFRFIGRERLAVRSQSLTGFSFRRHTSPLQLLGRGTATNRNARVLESQDKAERGGSFFDATASKTVLVSQRLEGFARSVACDEFGRNDDSFLQPSKSLVFAFCAERDPRFDELTANGDVSGAEFLHHLVDRHSADIGRDQLVSVKRRRLASHVYSVDTGLGYYTGSDSIVSIVQGNCYLVPLISVGGKIV